ncbi:MAG: hypothetical protein AB7O43_10700 [Hyphomicrobiaceae bacterium]
MLLAGLSLSVLFALGVASAMISVVTYILVAHDRNHEKFESWVDFSFNNETLRGAIGYYRLFAVSMLFAYVLFTSSLVWLQAAGYPIFSMHGQTVHASPIGVALFTLDLVLRGGFFDFMQHFDLRLSHVEMNRGMRWFVWYSFVFRMFYGLTMFKILFSFLWIYGKIRFNRQAQRRASENGGVTQSNLFK